MVELSFSEAELEARRQRIVRFVREQCDAAGIDGAILGLSGGVDSTLLAFLATEALGPDDVYCLSMPAAVSSRRHQHDAQAIAERLGVRFDVVPIESVVEAVVSTRPNGEIGEVARGNVRARVRAVLSYLVANEEGRLVLGTGNRSEALVGYFTKYGDGAVDCHPIGNLYKTQVRQLASHVGVPRDIVEKTPTAELWAEQTDEDELGIDYDTLDRILVLHVDGPLSPSATAETVGCSEATVDRVAEMVSTSAHKRIIPPSP